MTARDLLRRIDSREISEWIALFNIEPWGEIREDVRHGIRCAVAANVALGSKGHAKPADFIPNFAPRPNKAQSLEELKARFMAYTYQTGGEVKKPTKRKTTAPRKKTK